MMKTAIYIEDGVVQLVITPQSEFEKNALRSFGQSPMTAKVMSGSFYDCKGGWIRQKETYGGGVNSTDDHSLILRMDKQEVEIPPSQP